MVRLLIRLLSVFWLVFVTPVFGIIPLLVKLDVPLPFLLHNLDMAILRGLYDLVSGDSTDEYATHLRPPLTEAQWWGMIAITLTTGLLAAVQCFRWWRETQRLIVTENVLSASAKRPNTEG